MTTTVAKARRVDPTFPNSIRPVVQEPRAAWRVRAFEPPDTHSICDWVHSRQLLHLVSSDEADCLTPSILARWLDHAMTTIVILNGDTNEPVGFCTLSDSEIAAPPPQFLELCHLVVDPRYRYLFIGPRICKAAKRIARERAVAYLYGRVVPHHRYGIALARYERFEELAPPMPHLPEGFRWFRFALSPMASNA